MARDISITISVKDNFSDAVTKMKNAGMHFNKNIEEMQVQLKALNSNRTTIKVETKEAQKGLQALQKEYSEAQKKSKDGVVSSELIKRLDAANEEYERMRRNMRLLDKSARETEKSLSNASGGFSKIENKAGGGAKSSLMSLLADTGALEIGGEMLYNIFSAGMASKYGDIGSIWLSSIASGMASGAAVGTVLGGPGIGTAVGAGLGAIAGAVNASTPIYTNEDEAFKSYRDELITSQTNRIQSDISAGSGIAAQQELDRIAFAKLLGGDSIALDYLAWVRETANSTPLLYDDLKTISKTLATYGFTPQEMRKRLIQIGDTGSALGMSTSDMSMVATGLGHMHSSGKAGLEHLNILIERDIPAIDYLAKVMGATNDEVYDMVSKGLIPGAKAAEIIADAMGGANKGSMEEMAETYSVLTSTLQGLEQEMQAAYGDGYNQERSEGLKNQIDYLKSVDASETNKKIGAYYASLENEKEEIIREHEKEAYARIKQEGITDEAEIGRILIEARISAIAEYNASEGAQHEAQSQRALITAVGAALVADKTYWNAGYLEGLERSKGMAAAISEYSSKHAKEIVDYYGDPNTVLSLDEWKEMYPWQSEEGYAAYVETRTGAANAYGLLRVPYDNFPARLHEGERVLTASEAKSYNSGSGVTVNINGSFQVREEADIDKVARTIAHELMIQQMVS